jgi:hypothetical protein
MNVRILRKVRVSLRWLLLFFLVACLTLGYLAHHGEKIRRARQEINRIRGNLEYAHQFNEQGYKPQSSAATEWLPSRINDFFVKPWHVDLFGTNATDSDLSLLDDVKDVRILSAGLTEITDEGTIIISRMRNLTCLRLEATRVTDFGVSNLIKLKRLQDLDLGSTSITDKCIEDLSQMASLRYLNIAGTKISRNGFKTLRSKLPECEIEF